MQSRRRRRIGIALGVVGVVALVVIAVRVRSHVDQANEVTERIRRELDSLDTPTRALVVSHLARDAEHEVRGLLDRIA
ncbi:MAG: hypothetical protein WCA29_02850 [Jiangellales bacterium]